jgi:hypothetical protein
MKNWKVEGVGGCAKMERNEGTRGREEKERRGKCFLW